MIKWAPYSFARITVCFSVGIGCYTAFQPEIESVIRYVYALAAFGSIGYVLLWHFTGKQAKREYNDLFGAIALLLVFASGILLTHLRTESNLPQHFLYAPAVPSCYEGRIVSEIEEKSTTHRFEVEMHRVLNNSRWQPVTGNVLVSLEKDSLPVMLRYGDVLVIRGSPVRVAPPANPATFDYRRYLQYRQVYHQHYLHRKDFKVIGNEPPGSIMAIALAARKWCKEVLATHIPVQEAQGITTALVLGIKDGLDAELKETYSATGTMHILAVSGMHVALLFQLFSLLLGGLKKSPRGHLVFVLLALLLLWFYALVTGLSASVLRAVCMFSFLVVAPAIRRQANVYNTMAVSAFVLLCYDPYLLMDVGFQLSYMAVLGILFFYRRFYRLYTVPYPASKKKKLTLPDRLKRLPFVALDYVWSLACASVAAQVATLPLILFYFHQFPLYFLLANFAAIPLSTLVLYFGLLQLALSWWNWLASAIGWLICQLVAGMNGAVRLIESMPLAVAGGIDIHWLEAAGMYAVIVLLVMLLYYRRMVYLAQAAVIVLAIGLNQLREYAEQSTQQQLVFHHIPQHSLIHIINGHYSTLLMDSLLQRKEDQLRRHVYGYCQQQGIGQITKAELDKPMPATVHHNTNAYDLLVYRGRKILVLKSRPQEAVPPETDFLVITRNSIRKLADLQGLRFRQLIIDSSNKKYLARRLKHQADSLKLPCHATGIDGALIVNISD